MQPVRQSIDELSEQAEHLSKLMPTPETHQKLQGLLKFTASLMEAVNELLKDLASSDLTTNLKQSLTKCELVN
jgi:hypothetical protein